MSDLQWADRPRDKDYRAAERYLSFGYEPAQAARLGRKLRSVSPEKHRADDVLRACGLDPLSAADPRVQRAGQRMNEGKPLPPPLVVATSRGPDLANGYHHLSLVYHYDPASPVPVLLARDF